MAKEIRYNPNLSVKKNAKNNGVSEATIRHYIRENAIDRRFDKKITIIEECRSYLKKHPKCTKRELIQKTGHSASTIHRYKDYIFTEKEYSDFDKSKVQKRMLRQRNNFYATHPSCTWDILREEKFGKKILEPFCGSGSMAEVIKESGRDVVAYDIVDRGYGEIADFFKTDFPKGKYDIITNPPYDEELITIIKKLLSIYKNKIALLLPILYLNGKERYDEIYSKTPPARVYFYTGRINIAKNADWETYNNKGANMTIYAWFVWERGHQGGTELKWIHNNISAAAKSQVPINSKKDRGGFYTPPVIADFLVKWALNGKENVSILEPSCGDGVFLKVLKEHPECQYGNITALEIDGEEATKASLIDLPDTEVLNTDFYRFCLEKGRMFDAIVGNPPYIRSHRQDKKQKELAEQIFIKAGVKVSKMASSWASFIVGATLLLQPRGRLAMVVPAEILQVNYSIPIRQYLTEQFNSTIIISFRHLVIDGIQQDVILLLCDRDGSDEHSFEQVELKDADELKCFDIQDRGDFVVSSKDRDFLNKVATKKKISTLSKYADVEVGITTGADKYFLVDSKTIDKYELTDYAKPAIGRSFSVTGAIYTKKDSENTFKQGVRSKLLVFPPNLVDVASEKTMNYINKGVINGINKGYKTSIRSPWFVVPSVHVSDALFTRQCGDYTRLILNKAKVLTTGSLHRVGIKDGIQKEALVASFYNSLTFASVELSGRTMGGGALSLLPKEIEGVFIPYNAQYADLLPKIDRMLKKGRAIEDILDVTDEVILRRGLGLSKRDINHFRDIWKNLRNHRKEKKKK